MPLGNSCPPVLQGAPPLLQHLLQDVREELLRVSQFVLPRLGDAAAAVGGPGPQQGPEGRTAVTVFTWRPKRVKHQEIQFFSYQMLRILDDYIQAVILKSVNTTVFFLSFFPNKFI